MNLLRKCEGVLPGVEIHSVGGLAFVWRRLILIILGSGASAIYFFAGSSHLGGV